MPEETDKHKEFIEKMYPEDFYNEFRCLIRSRVQLSYLVAKEESRVLDFLRRFCRMKERSYNCYVWDSYRGLVNLLDNRVFNPSADGDSDDSFDGDSESLTDFKGDPIEILEHIISVGQEKNAFDANKQNPTNVHGAIFVLMDFYRFLYGNPPNIDIERRLKTISCMKSFVSTIMVGASYKITDILEDCVPMVEFPSPSRNELKSVIDGICGYCKKDLLLRGVDIEKSTEQKKPHLIDAVSGLTMSEAMRAFNKSIIVKYDWDIPLILREKKQSIRKSGILDFFDNPVGIDQVGGLKNLIKWVKDRKNCFSDEAKNYGIKTPKGMLSIGAPGSGKSLVCKAVSSYWEMPLLRLDFGKMFSSLIGSSEKNIREALKLAEDVSPCILWIDEIEKAISGSRSSGTSDGGTTSRVLSTFLTWMQEKTSPVFVVATANDHKSIPPEFMRAGRFDEIFFVDLPTFDERKEIYSVILKRNNLDVSKFNLDILSKKSVCYSGAEIEKSIDNAMLRGFQENQREINTDDIVSAIKSFKPLYEMRSEEFDELRQWANERTVRANSSDSEKVDMGTVQPASIDL